MKPDGMRLGPVLTKNVATIVPQAYEIYGNPIDEEIEIEGAWADFAFWLSEIAIPKTLPEDSLKLLKDTPDLVSYCINLNDLYPMEAVTPGWFIGEAAYQAVRDEVRSQLGLAEHEEE